MPAKMHIHSNVLTLTCSLLPTDTDCSGGSAANSTLLQTAGDQARLSSSFTMCFSDSCPLLSVSILSCSLSVLVPDAVLSWCQHHPFSPPWPLSLSLLGQSVCRSVTHVQANTCWVCEPDTGCSTPHSPCLPVLSHSFSATKAPRETDRHAV